MKNSVAWVALLALVAASCARSSLPWKDDLLVGKTYDVGTRGLRLIFSASNHDVDVRQGPGGPMPLVGRVGLWTWRVEGPWLVFADESGRIHDKLLLRRQDVEGLEAARDDGTDVLLQLIHDAAARPNQPTGPTAKAGAHQ